MTNLSFHNGPKRVVTCTSGCTLHKDPELVKPWPPRTGNQTWSTPGQPVVKQAGWLVGWLAVFLLAGWLDGWFAGWLAGRCQADWLATKST